jgi:hypothetical protein
MAAALATATPRRPAASLAPGTTVTPGILVSAWARAARTAARMTVWSMPSISMKARSWTVSPTAMGAQAGSSTSW